MFLTLKRSFTSRSYCCSPGGGYFTNDWSTEPFTKWGFFHEFRPEVGHNSISVSAEIEQRFFHNSSNFYVLDGYTTDGNSNSPKISTSYYSYFQKMATMKSEEINSRKKRGVGVLTMPSRVNYEFGGAHIYDTYEKGEFEIESNFGPKVEIVVQKSKFCQILQF